MCRYFSKRSVVFSLIAFPFSLNLTGMILQFYSNLAEEEKQTTRNGCVLRRKSNVLANVSPRSMFSQVESKLRFFFFAFNDGKRTGTRIDIRHGFLFSSSREREKETSRGRFIDDTSSSSSSSFASNDDDGFEHIQKSLWCHHCSHYFRESIDFHRIFLELRNGDGGIEKAEFNVVRCGDE